MTQLFRRIRLCFYRLSDEDLTISRFTVRPPFFSFRRPLAKSGLPLSTQKQIHALASQITCHAPEYDECIEQLAAAVRTARRSPSPTENPLHFCGKQRKAFIRDQRAAFRSRRLKKSRWLGRAARLSPLLIPLAWLASSALLFFSKPSLEIDYLARLNAPSQSVPPQDRAWPVYRDAILRLPRQDDRIDISFDYTGERPIDPKWPDTVHWLTQHAEIVDQIRTATRLPAIGWIADYPGQHSHKDQEFLDAAGGWNPRDLPSFDYYVSHRPLANWAVSTPLLFQRTVCRILVTDSWHAAELKDSDRVVRNAEALLQLIRQYQHSGNTDDALSASSVRMFLSDSMQEIISANPKLLNQPHLEKLAELLDHVRSPTWIDPTQALVMVDDVAQRLYTRRGWPTWQGAWIATWGATGHRNAEPTVGQRLGIAAAAPLIYAGAPSRKSVLQARHRLQHHLRVVANDPTDSRIYLISNTPEDSMAQFQQDLDGRLWDGLVVNALWPPRPEALLETHRRGEAAIDRLRLVVAMHRYRSRTGTWPTDLWDLTPHEIDRIPADPISGGVLGYRLLNGEPMLYSVGADGDDDGGATPLRKAGPHDPPEAPNAMYLAHDEARRPPSDHAPDGDWIIYPYPADPPAELPEPYDPDGDPYGAGGYGGPYGGGY